MSYTVEFSEAAKKRIKKLDRFTRMMIYNWVGRHLEGTDDPFAHGHALMGSLSGLWRYRIGDYRIIAKIEKDRLIILVLNVGHRSVVYNRQNRPGMSA